MARIRNTSPTNNSAAGSRKRSRESASPARSPKRRPELNLDLDAPDLGRHFSRENSPSKNVHWGQGKRLISGPSRRTSQSPTRSALRRPALDENDHGDGHLYHDHDHGPSAQLHADMCLADKAPSPGTKQLKQPFDPKKLPPGVGNIYVDPAARTKDNTTTRRLSGADNPYVDADEDICHQIEDLKAQVFRFAESLPHNYNDPLYALSKLMKPENKQLVRYAGCIAMGGAGGEAGWEDLFHKTPTRRSLVMGIIGKALKENVFDEIYFGAWPKLEEKLVQMERAQAQQDGFFRQRSRGDEIAKQVASFSRHQNDECFNRAVVEVTLGIQAMLKPLHPGLGRALFGIDDGKPHYSAALFDIVLAAGKIARAMRASGDVIYYFPPTLKDEEFEPPRMECLNLSSMILASPYDKQNIKARDRPILRDPKTKNSQAIVRIVCFPGIQAYRQGGGSLAKKQLAAERNGGSLDRLPPDVAQVRRRITNKHGEAYTGHEGFRTRIISKSVVWLQWGEQRLLTKEAGTSVHIDAVKKGDLGRYSKNKDGFKELYEIFKERVGGSPVRPPQRSPSFFEWLVGSAEPEEEEEQLPVARFKEQYEGRKRRRSVRLRSRGEGRQVGDSDQ